jgi:hypothetical protein
MSERRRNRPLLSTEAHAERVREKTVTPDRSLHSLDTAASHSARRPLVETYI